MQMKHVTVAGIVDHLDALIDLLKTSPPGTQETTYGILSPALGSVRVKVGLCLGRSAPF